VSSDNKISFYNSAKDTAPSREITIRELVRSIRAEDHAEGVALVRSATTEDEKRLAKMKLPSVQVSGCVTAGNRAQAIQNGRFLHSGWLQLDVDGDGLGMRTPQQARAILGADPHVACAFITPSGAGAKALFRIQPCATDVEHKAAFRAVEKYIADTYGMTLDPSTKDTGRLCYLSADKECTWAPFAEEFVPPVEKSPESAKRTSSKTFPVCPESGIHSWLMEASWFCRLQDRMTESETVTKLAGFNGTLRRMFQENEVRDAVAKVFSSSLPSDNESEIPTGIFPVPSGGVAYTESADIIFTELGKARRLFSRGGMPHEVRTSPTQPDSLSPITPERFCSLVEGFGHRVCRKEITKNEDGKNRVVWRKTGFPVSSSKILLETDASRNQLPQISQISASFILTKNGELLGRGYHDHGDGVLVTSKSVPVEMPIASARTAIMGLIADFLFTSPSDKSRAVASFLSPALKAGGWIDDDFPLDVAEADQSQSGKTYRQKLVCKIYGETPSAIISSRGGVGSLDESIATALIKGRPFIALDNFRGRLDSTLLEEATRGHEVVTCRALRTSVEVRTRPFNFQLSTNGAEFTRDVSNRSIITRIRKQSPDYNFRTFPEGDLDAHVSANQSFYLGAVFSVIREWKRMGCPKTNDNRHAFRGWTQALDGIIQHVMELPPLLDGHREQQERTANPALQWLRDIILAASPSDIGREMNTGQVLRIADDAGIEFPGNPNSKDDPAIRAGRILGKLFRDTDGQSIIIDGFTISRIEAPDYSSNADGGLRKFYTINRA
jgi:hypothetical protein